MHWTAHFTDGETAASRSVEVRLDAAGLHLTGDAVGHWPLDACRFDAIQRGVTFVRVEGMPHALLTVHGEDFKAILKTLGIRTGALPTGKTAARFAAVAGVAIIAVTVLAYLALDPLSRAVARWVPLSWEEKLTPAILAHLGDDPCEGEAGREALDVLVTRLEGDPEKVRVLPMALPNAFALPGGQIILTQGLLETVPSPDAVAAILAHEMAHVSHRHVMTQVVRALLMTTAWTVLFGDYTGVLVLDPATLQELVQLSYSREAEREADADAFMRLAQVGIAPSAFADGLEAITGEHEDLQDVLDDASFFSSHPVADERLAAARAAPLPEHPKAALAPEAWAALQGICE